MSAPTIYHYHPGTGEFLGTGEADPSPLQPGVWLDPANSTRTPIVPVPPGHVCVWSGGAWGPVRNCRGETWWKDGEPHTIDFLGDPAAIGFIEGPPPEPGPNEVRVWENDGWIMKPDHRGETWWADGEPVVIEDIGDPAALGLSSDGPPEVAEKQIAVWEDGAWVIKPDHRGEIWYTGHDQPVLVEEIGDPAANGWTPENPPAPPEPEPEPPEPPATLSEAVPIKLAELSAKRFAVETGGTMFGTMPLKTDRETCAIITAAYVKAVADPNFTISNWKLEDGVFVTLDAATIIAVGDAMSAHVQAAFDREAILTAEILALETAEAVNAYDVELEWNSP